MILLFWYPPLLVTYRRHACPHSPPLSPPLGDVRGQAYSPCGVSLPKEWCVAEGHTYLSPSPHLEDVTLSSNTPERWKAFVELPNIIGVELFLVNP